MKLLSLWNYKTSVLFTGTSGIASIAEGDKIPTVKTLLSIALIAVLSVGCANVATLTTSSVHAQEGNSTDIVEGHYIFQSQGWLNNTLLVDSGTMEISAGTITQCGGGAYGTTTSPMGCATHWTFEMGKTEFGAPTNPLYGYATSDQGDKATIACTSGGKVCILTGHYVQWAWSARIERE